MGRGRRARGQRRMDDDRILGIGIGQQQQQVAMLGHLPGMKMIGCIGMYCDRRSDGKVQPHYSGVKGVMMDDGVFSFFGNFSFLLLKNK